MLPGFSVLYVLYPPGPLLGHSSHPLSDYEYVYQCRKFTTEVRVVLVENVAMETSTCSRKEVGGNPRPKTSIIIAFGIMCSLLEAMCVWKVRE